jgi:predicted nuclease of predicted toxin-antitoxin system
VRRRKVRLRLFLDEGVPDSVGNAFRRAGHDVVLLRNSPVPRASPDQLVCAFAEITESILVAFDGDMKQIAKQQGVGAGRFKKLSLIKLSCRETEAGDRVKAVMSLIEHEWHVKLALNLDRMYIEILTGVIRTNR